MNPKRLHQRWQDSLESRLDSIVELLRRQRPLSATEVHDLRVALRRARLLARLGAPLIGRSEAKQFREATRARLDLLDPVRDYDVALDWLRDMKASASLITKLQLRRDRLWLATRNKLKLPATATALGFKAKHGAKKLNRRLEKLLETIAELCQKTVQRGNEVPTTELHELRRVVRRWRYLRELQLTSNAIRRDARLKRLLTVQESLGELQDRQVILDRLLKAGRSAELRNLRATLQRELTTARHVALDRLKLLPLRP